MLPMTSFQASPMLMAPNCRGETRIPAVELSMRYLPNSVGGSGAGLKISAMVTVVVVVLLSRRYWYLRQTQARRVAPLA